MPNKKAKTSWPKTFDKKESGFSISRHPLDAVATEFVQNFWRPGLGVWSDRFLSENKVMRMHGVVTGFLTRLIVSTDSPNNPTVSTPAITLPQRRPPEVLRLSVRARSF